MLFNNDMWECIADVEILGHIQPYDWPDYKWTFGTPWNTACTKSIGLMEEGFPYFKVIIADIRYNCPKFALWVAINCPNTNFLDHLNDLNLPVLYNNGFITNFEEFGLLAYSAINRKEVSIDALAIITTCRPDLYSGIFDIAIKSNKVEVIEWLYATKPSVITASHSELIDKNVSDAIMEFYHSTYPDWLLGAHGTIMQKLHDVEFVYRDALVWLIAKTDFDILSHVSANDGEMIEGLIRRANYSSSVTTIKYLLTNFSEVITTLSPERIESIMTFLYMEYDLIEVMVFMDYIPQAKIPAGILKSSMHPQHFLQDLYNCGRISGDVESIKEWIFAEYEEDAWYDQF